MNLNGEAFIPPVCPAIKTDDPDENISRGFIITPDMSLLAMEALDREGNIVSPEGPSAQTMVFAWLALREGVYAPMISEWYQRGTPEDQLMDKLDVDPKNEIRLGRRYCTRIKKCQGIFERDGKKVCQALDPQDFVAEVKKLYPDT